MMVDWTGLPSRCLWRKNLKELRGEGQAGMRWKSFANWAPLQMLVAQLIYVSVNSLSQANLTSQISLCCSFCLQCLPSKLSRSLKSWASTHSSDFHYGLLHCMKIDCPSVCLHACWPLAALSALLQFSWHVQGQAWYGENCRHSVHSGKVKYRRMKSHCE